MADRQQGLTGEEARERLTRDGANVLPQARPKPLLLIVRDVVTEPMFLMLLAAASVYMTLGNRAEAAFLMLSVIFVIVLTLMQERRTQRALEALRDLSAPLARVIRDNQEVRIPSSEVVRGDLLVLREGDRIAADATMLDGSIDVDESLLTGESVPVPKNQADGHAAVYAGTVVTRGHGAARVVAIATQTAIGQIGQSLLTTVETTSALQQASRKLIKRFTLAALGCAIALTLLNWLWDHHSLLESLLAGVALAIAILPEEIPVVLTVFLALGAWRIARVNVLTRRITAVETLGAITTLAVDKTGTLTKNRMTVAEVHASCANCDGPDGTSTPAAQRVAYLAAVATPTNSADPMEHAIRDFATRLPGNEGAVLDDVIIREYPLAPNLLAMSRVMRLDPEHHLVAAKGAPETVVELCRLPDIARADVEGQVREMAQRGLRVLAVASAVWDDRPLPQSQRDFSFRFAGLLGLADPPRPDAALAIAECRAAGIRVLMMTGDHEVTARAIAMQVGISQTPHLMTGQDIERLSDDELAGQISEIDVFARVQPHHKLRLVKALQRCGEIVGMTGDGVNDAPALKAADVGVAMGERGTDVAREAASLVLLDDSFSSLVAAVRQGRRIDDNIAKATQFVVAVHVPVVALALIPSLLNWPILITPVQIVLLELLIDPACSIVFEAASSAPDIMTRAPRSKDYSPFRLAVLGHGALQGLGVAMLLLGGFVAANAINGDVAQGRAASFLGLVMAVFLLTLANHAPAISLWRIKWNANPWLGRMLGGVALVLATMAGLPSLRLLLGLGLPGTATLAVMGCVLLGCIGWLEVTRRVLTQIAHPHGAR